jgi:starvation-inducible DNA-binding protein
MIVSLPSALDASVRGVSTANLKQLLVDTLTLRDLYKRPTLYELHRLFDKHFDEQSGLADFIAGRIQSLGGVSIAMARPPRGRDDVAVQIARLLRAHEIVLKEARAMARQAAAAGDGGTNDLLVSDVIPTNERQVWFVGEHLVGPPLMANEHEPA